MTPEDFATEKDQERGKISRREKMGNKKVKYMLKNGKVYTVQTGAFENYLIDDQMLHSNNLQEHLKEIEKQEEDSEIDLRNRMYLIQRLEVLEMELEKQLAEQKQGLAFSDTDKTQKEMALELIREFLNKQERENNS